MGIFRGMTRYEKHHVLGLGSGAERHGSSSLFIRTIPILGTFKQISQLLFTTVKISGYAIGYGFRIYFYCH